MRYPKDLQKNGAIGFLAPSFGCATQPYKAAFENSLKKWENLGYRTKLGPNCFSAEGVGISNTTEKCGQEVMDMFADTEVDILISCGGGELMCGILDHVDFVKLAKEDPKWYLGYSDNTNLTFLLTTLCDTASIYGPCAAAFGMEPWHTSLQDTLDLLTGEKSSVDGYELWEKESLKDEEHPLEPYHVTEPNEMAIYIPSEDGRLVSIDRENADQIVLSGRLLGGCLDCLQVLCGTRYDKVKEFNHNYEQDGIIWYLESCDLNVFSIRRALWQLKNSGWFSNTKGFLIGRPANGEGFMGLDFEAAVLEILKEYKVPVFLKVDIGHVAPMMPIINGSLGIVGMNQGKLHIEMKRV